MVKSVPITTDAELSDQLYAASPKRFTPLMQAAASNENGAMMGFMGMNMAQQNGVNLMGAVNNMQPTQNQAAPVQDSTAKLLEMKKLLDAGAITQEDYDKVKAQVLGL